MLNRFLSRLLQTGIDDKTDASLVKNIRVLNGIVLLVLASQISTLPLTLYFFKYASPLLYVCLLMICLTSLGLVLNKFKKHFAASLVGALASINNISLYTLFLGTRSNVHFLMPAVMIGAFYYFPYNRTKAMFGVTAFSLLAFIALEVRSFTNPPLLQLPDSAIRIMIVFVDLTFVFITFGFMYYGYYIYRAIRDELEERTREIGKPPPQYIASSHSGKAQERRDLDSPSATTKSPSSSPTSSASPPIAPITHPIRS